MAEGYVQDILTRIINVQWATGVYVVITAAKADYAAAGKEGVEVLDTKHAPGPQSLFMTGTLIQCSAGAGDNFAVLHSSLVGGPGGESGGEGSTLITAMVYPKTDDVRTSWWTYAQAYQGMGVVSDSVMESGPFLWIAQFRAYDPVTVNFKIRFEPHLVNPPVSGTGDSVVEAYPTTGAHTGHGGANELVTVTGFQIALYRTDKEGVGPVYKTPPGWAVDVIDSAFAELRGLLFGKDPPLIEADIPYAGL